MISEKMEAMLNEQINAELWSAYLYLSMSADFAAKGYPGFAHWMHIQFKEEQDHAIKLLNFIVSRGGKPILKPIKAVKTEWKNPLEAFTDTLQHEREVTSMIGKLFDNANKENDFATASMLKWYIDEQVEEEENDKTLIDALTMIEGNGFGLYTLDKELATRVYKPTPKKEV